MNQLVETFETPSVDIPHGEASGPDGTRVKWDALGLTVERPGASPRRFTNTDNAAVQLSRWRRRKRTSFWSKFSSNIDQIVEELHVQVRTPNERVNLAADVTREHDQILDGLPWLAIENPIRVDQQSLKSVVAVLANNEATLSRWQDDEMGKAPELGAERSLGIKDRVAIVFGGFTGFFGLLWLAICLPAFLAFGSSSDLASLTFDPDEEVSARVTRIEASNSTENDVKIFEYHYEFEDEQGQSHTGVSFRPGLYLSPGDTVRVEYEAGKPEVSRIEGYRMAPFGPWTIFLVGIFPVIGFAFLIARVPAGIRELGTLRRGVTTTGVLVDKRKTGSSVNKQPVWELIFEFQDHQGVKRRASAKTHKTHRLEDEPRERLLYERDDPDKGLLIDALPGSMGIDENGQLKGDGGWGIPILVAIVALELLGIILVFVL